MSETPDKARVQELDDAVQHLVEKAERLRQELGQVEEELLQLRDADMRARRAIVTAETGERPHPNLCWLRWTVRTSAIVGTENAVLVQRLFAIFNQSDAIPSAMSSPQLSSVTNRTR